MSADVLIESPKVTIGFERKVNLGKYESAVASIFMQVPTTPDAESQDIVAAAKLTFADAKATVYEQLGIPMDVVEGVVVESLQKQLGAVEVTPADEEREVSNAGGQRANTSTSGGGAVPATTDEAIADLLANPKGWFDNRKTKQGKQPDFKRKGAPAPGEKYPPSLWVDSLTKAGAEAPAASAF